ncbi:MULTISPECIES: hypothetical protein [unclassified Methylococcus]|uniref:hypothetical protein n=1 Tax=unclassified Methylococcus TaxID=2618889 RepID=UPI00059C8750
MNLLVVIVFVAGFGWGQWWAERQIRIERASLEIGRLSVSMPMNPDDAAATFGLLKTLMEQVERERK